MIGNPGRELVHLISILLVGQIELLLALKLSVVPLIDRGDASVDLLMELSVVAVQRLNQRYFGYLYRLVGIRPERSDHKADHSVLGEYIRLLLV